MTIGHDRRNRGTHTHLDEMRRRAAAAVSVLLAGTEDDEQQEAQPEEARARADDGILVDHRACREPSAVRPHHHHCCRCKARQYTVPLTPSSVEIDL